LCGIKREAFGTIGNSRLIGAEETGAGLSRSYGFFKINSGNSLFSNSEVEKKFKQALFLKQNIFSFIPKKTQEKKPEKRGKENGEPNNN